MGTFNSLIDFKMRLFERKNFMIFLFFLIINLQSISSSYSECQSNPTFNNKKCFNNIFKFDNKRIKPGQISTTKNDDLIIEFSEKDNPNLRSFYGLKNDGTNYFKDANGILEYNLTEVNINGTEDYVGRGETNNLIISLENENNKNNQYLFSVNLYKSNIELHDLNSVTPSYYIWDPKNLFNLGNSYINLNDFFLTEINNGTEFIIVFTIAEKIKGDLYKYFVAKSFKLNSFNQDAAYEEINTTKLNDGEDIKIINSFLLNKGIL